MHRRQPSELVRVREQLFSRVVGPSAVLAVPQAKRILLGLARSKHDAAHRPLLQWQFDSVPCSVTAETVLSCTATMEVFGKVPWLGPGSALVVRVDLVDCLRVTVVSRILVEDAFVNLVIDCLAAVIVPTIPAVRGQHSKVMPMFAAIVGLLDEANTRGSRVKPAAMLAFARDVDCG